MDNFNRLNTLIFDLGGVIVNLNLPLCISMFEHLGFKNADSYLSNYGQKDFFLKYELGVINTEEFVKIIGKIIPSAKKQQIIDAWCAFLQDIPERRLEILKKLKTKYRLLLLSNTNPLHFELCAGNELKKYGSNFDDLFDKCYLSYRLGISKPDSRIFEHIIYDAGLQPAECVLIDDGQKNIEMAQSLGFQTFHITGNNTLENLFDAL